jgi:hypothetical protein
MHQLNAASILIRTREGARAVLQGEDSPVGATASRMRLLLRLNGHTPLYDLARHEPLEGWLAVADELVAAGLAAPHDAHQTRMPSQSQWGDLVELPVD